jgi:ribosomal protein S6--L-glutamate ligase
VRVGVLAWDGETDPDLPALMSTGQARGHQITVFTVKEISYRPDPAGGFDVSLAGHQVSEFDAIISRAKLYGADWQDRVERLTLLSNVPGVRMFAPADAWVTGYSKLLCTQRLAQAGFPVPPTRSATSMADVQAAFDEWGMVIVKPSFQYSGTDVERVTDMAADADMIAGLLAKYSTLACMPFWPTKYGEYRLTVAGEACVTTLKLPPPGAWRCKTLEGASFERVDGPPELVDMAVRATRLMGLALSGVDALPTEDGYVILEVNPIPGFLDLHGEQARLEIMNGLFDWVERQVTAS